MRGFYDVAPMVSGGMRAGTLAGMRRWRGCADVRNTSDHAVIALLGENLWHHKRLSAVWLAERV